MSELFNTQNPENSTVQNGRRMVISNKCDGEQPPKLHHEKKTLKGTQPRARLCLSISPLSSFSNYSPIHGDKGMGSEAHSCLNTWANLHSRASPPDHCIYDLAEKWVLCSWHHPRPCKSTYCGFKPGNHHLKQSQGCVMYFDLGLTCKFFLGSDVSHWQYVCELTMYVLSVLFISWQAGMLPYLCYNLLLHCHHHSLVNRCYMPLLYPFYQAYQIL